MILVTCDCGRKLEAPDDKMGKRGRCPYCKAVLVMPTLMELVAAQPLDFPCEGCGHVHKLTCGRVGDYIQCDRCRARIRVTHPNQRTQLVGRTDLENMSGLSEEGTARIKLAIMTGNFSGFSQHTERAIADGLMSTPKRLSERDAGSHECGARTRSGSLCTRLVSGPGRCHQHR